VEAVESCRAAIESIRTNVPDAAIVDYFLGDGTALDLLQQLKETTPSFPTLILTGHGSIDLAVRAIKEGAEQFLTKPVDLTSLELLLTKAIERNSLRRQKEAGQALRRRDEESPFIGVSPAIRHLEGQAHRVAAADAPVLILGETGTGKGVLARWLHRNSPRSEDAFVDLNCAGFAREFLETELFGHEKGAFTGAVTAKTGLLELAHRGTAFLDEIGDMAPEVQAPLLKVIEEGRFRRLGDVRDRQVSVRLLAATHQPLTHLVREKRFRSDLYFRISTLPMEIPPLRQRPEDIPLIAEHLLRRLSRERDAAGVELTPDAKEALVRYAWPGNVRELRNVLERALLLHDGPVLDRRHLLFDPAAHDSETGDSEEVTLEAVERRHILRIMKAEDGHVERAAQRLGLSRSALYTKLKLYGVGRSRN
jgi:DNA-binding NtrC family response regulator